MNSLAYKIRVCEFWLHNLKPEKWNWPQKIRRFVVFGVTKISWFHIFFSGHNLGRGFGKITFQGPQMTTGFASELFCQNRSRNVWQFIHMKIHPRVPREVSRSRFNVRWTLNVFALTAGKEIVFTWIGADADSHIDWRRIEIDVRFWSLTRWM